MTLKDSPQQSLIPGGFAVRMSGLVDFEHGRYALKGTNAGQQTETRVIGRDRWTKVPSPLGFGAVGGKPWFHTVEKTSGLRSGLLQDLDPTEVLQSLTSKGRVISEQQVGDRSRTVVRIPADVLGQSSSSSAGDIDVTTETDPQGRIRLTSAQIKEASIGTITTEVRYDDFGIKVDVQPPPADQVQEVSELKSSTGSFSTTTGSSSPEDQKKACEQFRSFVKGRPAPTNEQERKQQAQFDEVVAKICATS
jgi:hypothetical protein